MKTNRRDFLKQTALAGTAVMGAACATVPAPMAEAPRRREAGPMARNMTLVTIAGDGGYGLGVKTERGILDVGRAKAVYRSAAPTTIDDLMRGGDRGLGGLVTHGDRERRQGLFLDEGAIEFGPCVTNPEKILCVGLNYARHARETNNPIPKLPILFNKFNNALNSHQGTVRVSAVPATNFDYESELVIVMGRSATNVSEADALSYVFGYCNGNDFTARDLQIAQQPVDDRQDLRRLRPARALPGDRRPGRIPTT